MTIATLKVNDKSTRVYNLTVVKQMKRPARSLLPTLFFYKVVRENSKMIELGKKDNAFLAVSINCYNVLNQAVSDNIGPDY